MSDSIVIPAGRSGYLLYDPDTDKLTVEDPFPTRGLGSVSNQISMRKKAEEIKVRQRATKAIAAEKDSEAYKKEEKQKKKEQIKQLRKDLKGVTETFKGLRPFEKHKTLKTKK